VLVKNIGLHQRDGAYTKTAESVPEKRGQKMTRFLALQGKAA